MMRSAERQLLYNQALRTGVLRRLILAYLARNAVFGTHLCSIHEFIRGRLVRNQIQLEECLFFHLAPELYRRL